jgi:Mg-chelatase subunit ChlI
LLNAVNPAVGGVLVEGPSGTGKSTAVRGFVALLPQIRVVADCPFSCDPASPCEQCADRANHGEVLAAVSRPVRLVTLPLNATEDRIAGSIDIARALHEGVTALEPGLLADVNRGILYVDEINLLDDHLCDILLDAAALGVNVVERESVSVSHPAEFLLVGTMNPEEGELRPQLADRIGLRVEIEALAEPDDRAEIMRRREAFTADPGLFAAAWADETAALADKVEAAHAALGAVALAPEHYDAIAQLVVRSGVTSHRADVTILQCAKALAVVAGRAEVDRDDLLEAALLGLTHRLEQDPFEPGAGIDERVLQRVLDETLDVDVAEKKAAGSVTRARSWS